jgi:hypothetical protein
MNNGQVPCYGRRTINTCQRAGKAREESWSSSRNGQLSISKNYTPPTEQFWTYWLDVSTILSSWQLWRIKQDVETTERGTLAKIWRFVKKDVPKRWRHSIVTQDVLGVGRFALGRFITWRVVTARDVRTVGPSVAAPFLDQETLEVTENVWWTQTEKCKTHQQEKFNRGKGESWSLRVNRSTIGVYCMYRKFMRSCRKAGTI